MKRIIKRLLSFALCVAMVLSPMPTVFAAEDEDVCILTAYDRASLNEAFDTINNGESETVQNYLIRICPLSQDGDVLDVLDAGGDSFEITRANVNVYIEAFHYDDDDDDESKKIINATIGINLPVGKLSTLNIGCKKYSDCMLIVEGGGYAAPNRPDVRLAMLKACGNIEMHLGANAVFQNNHSNDLAGCLVLYGDKSNYSVKLNKVFLEGATIKNCSSSNDARLCGGAAYVSCGKLIMREGSTITGCEGYCAAIHIYGSYGKFEMTGGSITDCYSRSGAGGAIFMNANMISELNITGGTITRNTAGTVSGFGGGIFIQNGYYRITGDAKIYGNFAAHVGDDIWVTGTMEPEQSGIYDISYNDPYEAQWYFDNENDRWLAGSTNEYTYVANADLNGIGLKAVATPTVSYEYEGEVPDGAADMLPAASKKTFGFTIEVEDAPVVPGYTFSGWNTTDATVYDGNKFSMLDRNVTFVGSFSPTTYNITYNLDGGTVSIENPATYTIKSDDITLNNPEKAGYIFDGWTGTDITTAQQTVTIPTGSTGDREYTANWTQIPVYNVTFNMNGHGDQVEEQKVMEGEKATKPDDPTANGYTFDGWYADENFTDAFDFNTAINADTTIYAKWTAVEYTITYDLDGGTVSPENPAAYTAESDDITLNNPEKAGYIFDGWTGTDITTAQQTVTIPAGSTGNREYTANWTQIPVYNVTFNMNGHGDQVEEQNVMEGEKATKPADPTASDYTFDGWYADENFTDAFDFNTAINADTTIYAKWTAVEYTITYDLDGGTVSTENPATYTVESDDITLNNPEKVGYIFDGWTGTDITTAQQTVTIPTGSTGDREYTANWTQIPIYTVTFNMNGHGDQVEEQKVMEGEKATKPADPTASGYTFDGWYADENFTDAVDFNTAINADTTIYAKWTAVEYTITYDLDGGTVSPENPATYTVESDDITLNNPEKDGYFFAGWTGTDITTAQQTVTIPTGSTGNREYTANWTQIPVYNVTFNMNGHGDQVEEQNVMEGEKATKPADPTASDYTFDGWYADATFSVPFDFNTAINADTTIYAKWTAVKYTITYNLDGGTVSSENPAAYTVESADITLNNPEKAGYIFAGWTGTDITTAQQTVTIPTGSTGNREYTANWTQIPVYTVTFNMNGHGNQVAEQKVMEGEKATKPADPTASGYTFNGWYADATFSVAFDFNTAINADTTIYAKWTENPADTTGPHTGDNSQPFLWVALMFISGGALVGSAVYRKKKKYSSK